MAYRLLTVLTVLYRRWGSIRFQDLAPWAHGWGLEEIDVGVGANGVEDAWMDLAIRSELGQLDGTPFCRGATDIVKCFDIDNNVFVNNLESVRKFMILVTAYNIVQYLNFIGYYLPLTQSRNVWQFQEIMDYFAQCSEGVDRVNFQQAIIEFDETRERTLTL